MIRRVNSREDILAAAEAVVGESGASHLTLDAVAEKAGISKGGLLYHFPSKEDLLRGMLSRQLEQADARREQVRSGEALRSDPAAGLKAYVEAAFHGDPSRERVCTALLAAAASDPRLVAPVKDWHARNFAEFSAGSHDPMRVLVLMLALDGLWLNEVMGTACFGSGLRERLREVMLSLAGEAVR